MKNIDSSFRQMRVIAVLLAVVCVVVSMASLYYAFCSQGRVYVLVGGAVTVAAVAEKKEYVPVIAKAHVRNFHQLFWTLEPDEKVIKNNIERALYLVDGSGKRLYDDLREADYYAAIVSGNVSQTITVDSIQLNLDRYPFQFTCWSTEKLLRTAFVTTRNLVTTGFLRTTGISTNNQYGFLIEKLQILDNRDIKTQNR